MKVGVDARLLSRPLTGIGRYTLEMCRALLKIENIALYLYSPSPISDDVKANLTGAHFREINWRHGVLRQLWSESYLPLWAKKDEVDVFWGPSHRLPRFLPRSIPSVVTIHDLAWKYVSETMRSATYLLERLQMPYAVRSADVVVADSQSTARALKLEYHLSSKQLLVIPLAATCTPSDISFNMLAEYGIHAPYFLFVGTLEPRKNLTRLLEAYALLPTEVKAQANLVIVGGKGWGDVNVADEVTRLSLSEYVRLLGYVDEELLSALYSHAEFLAMPSLYEGFGLPLLEAMVHGVPVLTADNSSMPEVAGDAGLLVDAQNIHSIEKGLRQLILNGELRGKLAENAKTNVARFSWDSSARQLVSSFERAITYRRLA
ncbi:MAG: glycosyltransferase family 1 protein [Cycloclasticus sp.]